MAQSLPLALNENNDEEINAILSTNQPTVDTALNLTGLTLEAYLKASPSASDTDASTWKGTTTGGQIVVTVATAGKVSIKIPAASITTAMAWWRLDVLDTGLRKTALYGVVSVTNL